MAQEFYHVNGPQQGPRRHDGPPHRPPQGPPGGNPQGHPFPPPPRNMIPVDLRGGPAVQISDISRDLFSESDMKEELTDYIVFRFEKMTDKDGLDDYGQPKWPSWEKAIRIEERSISKQVAANKVRQLNKSTKNVLDKKTSLPSPLKRQIDLALDYLMNREPDVANFHWFLAQIDHQLRPIEPYYTLGSDHHYTSARKHRSSTAYPFLSKRRCHLGRSSRRHKKKKAYERLSLTAYFQRVPRQGADIPRLWKEKRRGLEGMYQAYPAAMHNAFPQQQPNHVQFQGPQQQQHPQPQPQQQQQQQQHVGREQGPPPVRVPTGNPQGPHAPPPNRPMNPAPNQRNSGPGHGPKPRKAARHNDSESDSESDSYGSSSGVSRRGSQTPPSSVSEHRGHHHPKNRHAHPANGPGTHPHPHPHPHPRPATPRNERPVSRHRPAGNVRLPRTSQSPRRPSRAPAPPPYPDSRNAASVASHIERIREDAYRRGRLAERTDARVAEELAYTRARSRPRPRPHIVQSRYRGRRGVHVHVDHDDDDDDEMLPRYFSRVSLHGGGGGGEGEEEDEEDVEFRREYERRVQHGSIMENDPFAVSMPPSPSSLSYAYSTDGRGRCGPQIVETRRRMSHY
ncbi:hypothetical protein F4823DRAFT_636411 [Ustulina deusta]|nr:hypothetical protein F4823DRAFT_636411 [Ustulina deusta]